MLHDDDMANADLFCFQLLVQVWFDKMLGYRIAADIVAYNAFIAACAGKANASRAEELFTEARATCLSPDLVTYNTLLHAWARSASHQESQTDTFVYHFDFPSLTICSQGFAPC